MQVEPIRKKSDVKKLLQHLESHPRNNALFAVGINCGLRYSDLKRITVQDVKNVPVGQSFYTIETKTKKRRAVVINNVMREAIDRLLASKDYGPNDPIFQGSKKGYPLTWRSANELIKSWARFLGLRGRYGTHSLRKTFGYHQRKYGGVPIELLQRVFNHKNIRETMLYICIEDCEVDAIPMMHEIKY